eukprot:CAMPEP_0179361080 /NCGR_PEP_ID=MMETSP0797-20121207/80307_1 /TAXON_ID=47934 /ORGANISM="Dinophysis acuminata, Strain DAEP01" /LENGTH=247 /DNA_ID=CAMNT_0021076453 /DNA_START=233 /DNA_END=974 /DNA_ORIENTATION=+
MALKMCEVGCGERLRALDMEPAQTRPHLRRLQHPGNVVLGARPIHARQPEVLQALAALPDLPEQLEDQRRPQDGVVPEVDGQALQRRAPGADPLEAPRALRAVVAELQHLDRGAVLDDRGEVPGLELHAVRAQVAAGRAQIPEDLELRVDREVAAVRLVPGHARLHGPEDLRDRPAPKARGGDGGPVARQDRAPRRLGAAVGQAGPPGGRHEGLQRLREQLLTQKSVICQLQHLALLLSEALTCWLE